MNLPLPYPGDWPWISLHDVCPATLDATTALADRVEAAGRRATLLVIPNSGWNEPTLDRLRSLCARGHDLAGHGWSHQADRWGGLGHRLHGWLISNRVAEHLAQDSAGCENIIKRCYAWFSEQRLPEPQIYVPPAWAMGRLSRNRLQQLPFRYYETLAGVHDVARGRFVRLPLAGFEADRAWRAQALRMSNALNRQRAGSAQRLRIAVHPRDVDGPLRAELLRMLAPAV